MDFFNIDTIELRLPPKDVRITSLQGLPYPDGKRVHVLVQMTPFQQPPFLELSLVDMNGIEAGSASIIEPPHWNQELTMHIRNVSTTPGTLFITARVFYPEIGDQDTRSIEIRFPEVPEDQL